MENATYLFKKVEFNVTLKSTGVPLSGYQSIFMHTKRADFSVTFSGCRTKFHLDGRYGAVLTAACGYLFFEKVRFQYDLIFLYFVDAECLQFFV